MNPDQPSREQIETRITALLLGELPADEAALLRYTISQDPALQKLHDELQATLVLVKEATKNPEEPAVGKAEALKLSNERRQKLLAHFKTQRTKATPGTQVPKEPLFWLKRIEAPSVIRVLVLVAIIALLAALLLPVLSSANRKTLGRGTYGAHGFGDTLSSLAERTWSSGNKEQMSMKTNDVNPGHSLPDNGLPPASSPESLALTVVPQIITPPTTVANTQIILPQTEPTSEVAAQTEKPAETGRSHIFSQQVVGYANIPLDSNSTQPPVAQTAPANNPDQPALRTADTGMQDRMERAEKQSALQSATRDSSPDFARNKNTASNQGLRWGLDGVQATGGIGGGGGFVQGSANNAATFALNDHGGRQPAGQFPPASGGEPVAISGSPPVPAAPLPVASAAIPVPTAPPSAPVEMDLSSVAEQSLAKAPKRRYESSLRNRGASGSAGDSYYRNTEPDSASAAPGLATIALPSAMPIGGRAEAPVTSPSIASIAPAADTDYTIVSGDTLSKIARKDGVTLKALEEANPGVDPKKLRPGKKLTIPAPTGSTIAARARAARKPTSGLESESPAIELAKDGSERLGYLDNNGSLQSGAGPNTHFTSRYAFTAVPSAGQFGLITSTNYIASNGFVMNTFNPDTSKTRAAISGGDLALFKAQESDIVTNQVYAEALRQKLHINDDPHATGPMPTLDAATLQMINSHKIEEEKIYQEQLTQLQELKSIEQTNRGKLTEMLPQIAGDKALGDLIAKREEAGRTLTNITNDYPVDNSTVQRTASLLNELNREIDDRTTGLMAGLESRVASTKAAVDGYTAEVEEAQKNNVEEAKKNQPYYNARRELDEKLKMHQLLYSKLEAERLDSTLPAYIPVQITDPAEPNRNQTFWQRLTGQYASTARIKVENDVTDIPGFALNSPSPQGFDPYFVQTTFEIMQSPLVLSNVVEKLDLTSAWAKKNGGEKMSESEAISVLKKKLDFQPVKNTKLITINVTSDDPNEAANIANAVAQAYKEYRIETRGHLMREGVAALEEQFQQQTHDIATNQSYVVQLRQNLLIAESSQPESKAAQKTDADLPLRKPAPNTPVPQPEILARDNNFSTFSLNVSDVSFKFAEASLQNGKLPDTASIRSEEFINAFDYRDPEAAPGQPMAFTSERARYPFAHNRELLRFAIKTAAAGRQQGRALNLVLLLDNSGSMERADRVAIIHEALSVLATQLQPQDTVSVVTFSRTARLWADGVSGDKAGETLDRVGGITPEGGTNLEEAMRLAYETAHRHYLANGINRVVLLTDGAANLGDVNPTDLKQKVEAQRKQGIALDCFGIGWEDYNDDLLEQLSSNGDGRYAFLNSPEDASKDFAAKLAGALEIAAADVKVQVEFNPQRVISYRQIGYATHQLTKEQFRDNTVAAGQIAAQEAGNALYTIETNPNGEGPIATVHVRYKVPGTEEYREHSWNVDYTGSAPALDQSSPAMRLAATASAFSEWLAASPFAQEVTLDDLLKYLNGVPEVYGADDRPKQLETMIREAKSLEGK